MDEGMTVYGIGQVAVTVADLERAECFYREVLCLRHLFRAGAQLSFFDCAGLRLMLGPAEAGKPASGSSILYFRCEGIEAAFERFARLGVKIVEAPRLVARMPDHALWLGFFADSEGNTMALMEERELDRADRAQAAA